MASTDRIIFFLSHDLQGLLLLFPSKSIVLSVYMSGPRRFGGPGMCLGPRGGLAFELTGKF